MTFTTSMGNTLTSDEVYEIYHAALRGYHKEDVKDKLSDIYGEEYAESVTDEQLDKIAVEYEKYDSDDDHWNYVVESSIETAMREGWIPKSDPQ